MAIFANLRVKFKFDELVKSWKTPLSVIPANPGSGSGAGAGIQSFQMVTDGLDSGFHRSDNFLRDRQQVSLMKMF